MAELSPEEKTELQQKAADADMLHELISLPGWKEVLKPRLDRMREGLIAKMLSEQLDLQGFVFLQQSVNAVDSIMGGIDFGIAQGEDAKEKLKEE
jgi:hypothetical protein